MRLCKKRNKSATLRLLDVLATQHAKWTARRIRRALFGQSLVDFSGSTWSCIKIRGSELEPKPVNRRKQQTSRMMREFSQTEEKDSLVPGMAMYSSQNEDVDMNSDAGTANFSTNGDVIVSTSAVNQAEFSQSLDRNQEPINKKLDFLPATK